MPSRWRKPARKVEASWRKWGNGAMSGRWYFVLDVFLPFCISAFLPPWGKHIHPAVCHPPWYFFPYHRPRHPNFNLWDKLVFHFEFFIFRYRKKNDDQYRRLVLIKAQWPSLSEKLEATLSIFSHFKWCDSKALRHHLESRQQSLPDIRPAATLPLVFWTLRNVFLLFIMWPVYNV